KCGTDDGLPKTSNSTEQMNGEGKGNMSPVNRTPTLSPSSPGLSMRSDSVGITTLFLIVKPSILYVTEASTVTHRVAERSMYSRNRIFFLATSVYPNRP